MKRISARDQIRQEASTWVARLDGKVPSDELRASLHEWLQQGPDYVAEFRRMANLWGDLNVLTELAVPNESSATGKDKKWLGRSHFWDSLAIAACFAAVAVVLVWQMGWLSRWPTLNTETYSTAVGEQQLITLADGSTVLLNTNSHAEVHYDGKSRRIFLLAGEAFFSVKKDLQRPFLVYAGDSLIRAVGTAFSVQLTGAGVDLTTTEGTVELNVVDKSAARTHNEPKASGKPISDPTASAASVGTTHAFVSAGQKATTQGVIESIENVQQEKLAEELAWHDGMLRFSDDPLPVVIKEVSRYTDQTIIITDPRLQELRFGGQFKINQIDKLFSALESAFSVKVSTSANKTIELAYADSNNR